MEANPIQNKIHNIDREKCHNNLIDSILKPKRTICLNKIDVQNLLRAVIGLHYPEYDCFKFYFKVDSDEGCLESIEIELGDKCIP